MCRPRQGSVTDDLGPLLQGSVRVFPNEALATAIASLVAKGATRILLFSGTLGYRSAAGADGGSGAEAAGAARGGGAKAAAGTAKSLPGYVALSLRAAKEALPKKELAVLTISTSGRLGNAPAAIKRFREALGPTVLCLFDSGCAAGAPRRGCELPFASLLPLACAA